ncbi:histone-lysine N-methyltransferase SETDB1-B-like isoform X2 [Amphiura filiformis]|uniref:histone-lysine N-methyltransferase SETDB1-B-like isoform X2 n=1 Tax=Amphiura filiformis TaxID=82378 RepID=UPI003B222D35
MGDLDEAELLALLDLDDSDSTAIDALIAKQLIPQLEKIDKEYAEPIAKDLKEVANDIIPFKESINEIDSIFKSTRVLAEDLQAALTKEKVEIDQLIVDSKDAEQRTAENEAQLFQSKISSSNPFNLFYLYRSLDRKSHATTATTNTLSMSTVTNSSGVTTAGTKKTSGVNGASLAASSGPTANKDNTQNKLSTTVPSLTSDEPEIIDLCGGSEDVVPYDADYYQAPNPQPAEFAKGMKLLAKKKGNEGKDAWFEATLLNIINDQGNKKYKVKFDVAGKRLLSGKHIALKTHPTFEQVRIGSRVVALYRKSSDSDDKSTHSLYSGIIAELPMLTNKGRLLIFYDVGYAQYVDLDDMFLVYQPATNVWEDDMGDSRDFIMRYLKRYPERPMVRLAVGQWAKTEWNGVWWRAKVKEVDGSLALMHFESDNREEWIYRGSPRLEPLYSELSKAEEAERTGNMVASATSNPYKRRRPTRVEYTVVMKQQLIQPRTKNTAKKSTSSGLPRSPEFKKKGPTAFKSTSRDHHRKKHRHHRPKSPSPTPDIFELDDSEENNSAVASNGNEGASTSSPSPMVQSQSPSPVVQNQPQAPVAVNQPQQPVLYQSKMGNVTVADLLNAANMSVQHEQQQQFLIMQQQPVQQKQAKRKKRKNQKNFVTHNCNYYCVISCWPTDANKTFNKNPLRLPEICGWSRELCKTKGSGKRHVIYRTPCGRVLRRLEEVNRYLLETGINYLSVDHFSFDSFVYTLTRKPRNKPIWRIDDISKGTEPMPVSCVNELDSSPLPSVEYVAHRLPSGGTVINTDPEYLMCCDCTDNCMDKSKCACWQLTIESTAVNPSGTKDKKAGYMNRRLIEHLPTGIFECNKRCKCNQQCHNRVVQHGIKLRLQVFKTNKKGWGLRCLDDIPKGAFVCIYAGQIWKEDMANERGRLYGDEYFAELDYIEVVENNKEGYESDVGSDVLSDKGYNSSEDERNHWMQVEDSPRSVANLDEGSDEDYRAGSDSDADYVPKVGRMERGGRADNTSQSDTGSVGEIDGARPKELAQVSTRLTFRRQVSADIGRRPDTQWSVVPSDKDNQDKVADWVKDLPSVPSTSAVQDNNTTPTKASSNPASEPDTPTRLYGYNTNPGNVLDSKTLEAYRKRKEKEKALKRKKLDTELQKTPPGGSEQTGEITLLSSSDEENSRGSNNGKKNSSPASKPTTPGASEPSTPVNPQSDTNKDGGVMELPTIAESSGGGGGGGGFGGFQIEGITSLAVESDDTDESDTEGTKDDNKKTVPKSTQHSRMPLQMATKRTGPGGNASHAQGDGNRRSPPMRTRPYYGEEHHYIMDAKFIGNLGRYLNHSCSPNLFVQNVFVDTHDLRFPWVAFFAHERVRACTELTWDYNYDVGSVPGKSLICHCGSSQCKGRLL